MEKLNYIFKRNKNNKRRSNYRSFNCKVLDLAS